MNVGTKQSGLGPDSAALQYVDERACAFHKMTIIIGFARSSLLDPCMCVCMYFMAAGRTCSRPRYVSR